MSDFQNDSSSIDYSHYSLDELKQAYNSLDKELYPERAESLEQLIKLRTEQSSSSVNSRTKSPLVRSQVKFHGSGTEYFAIWIVNLFLSIITLGVYSAWATVRTNRYFYSNTEIAGHRLAYLATPIQILIGRAIAFVLFAIVLVGSQLNPFVGGIATIALFVLSPMIIVMGVRFRMRMMAYRNVRFNFKKRWGRAYVVFFLFPILAVITFYLALPWVLKKIDEFLYESMTYGDKPFKTKLFASEYYIATIVTGVVIFLGMLLVGGISFFGVVAEVSLTESPEFSFFMIIGVLLYLLVLVIGYSFYEAYIRNHVYNGVEIENVAYFGSDLRVKDLVMLSVTNYLLMVFSLGMAFPWVKVRTARLLCSATDITILDGIDDVIAESGGNESAVADEVIGAFDINVSIG